MTNYSFLFYLVESTPLNLFFEEATKAIIFAATPSTQLQYGSLSLANLDGNARELTVKNINGSQKTLKAKRFNTRKTKINGIESNSNQNFIISSSEKDMNQYLLSNKIIGNSFFPITHKKVYNKTFSFLFFNNNSNLKYFQKDKTSEIFPFHFSLLELNREGDKTENINNSKQNIFSGVWEKQLFSFLKLRKKISFNEMKQLDKVVSVPSIQRNSKASQDFESPQRSISRTKIEKIYGPNVKKSLMSNYFLTKLFENFYKISRQLGIEKMGVKPQKEKEKNNKILLKYFTIKESLNSIHKVNYIVEDFNQAKYNISLSDFKFYKSNSFPSIHRPYESFVSSKSWNEKRPEKVLLGPPNFKNMWQIWSLYRTESICLAEKKNGKIFFSISDWTYKNPFFIKNKQSNFHYPLAMQNNFQNFQSNFFDTFRNKTNDEKLNTYSSTSFYPSFYSNFFDSKTIYGPFKSEQEKSMIVDQQDFFDQGNKEKNKRNDFVQKSFKNEDFSSRLFLFFPSSILLKKNFHDQIYHSTNQPWNFIRNTPRYIISSQLIQDKKEIDKAETIKKFYFSQAFLEFSKKADTKQNQISQSINDKKVEYIHIDIWTNGSISPRQSIMNGFKKLFELFYNFSKYIPLKIIEL